MTENNQNRLIPVSKWHQFHCWPSQAALRNLIFNKKTNGFGKVVRRVGRRVLIDEQSFFNWVEQQNSEEEV